MDDIDLRTALDAMTPGTKAARLRTLLPLIEAKLSVGVRMAEVVRVINQCGLAISPATLKSYLYRYRKQQVRGMATHALPVKTTSDRARAEGGQPVKSEDAGIVSPSGRAIEREGMSAVTALSLQDLERVMRPDPSVQAEEIEYYEQLAYQGRKAAPP